MDFQKKCDLLLESNKDLISFKEMIMKKYTNRKLVVPVGKDKNNDIYLNLEKVHGLFIAGATGTGKSVFLDNIIGGLIIKNNPDNLKFVFLDPKKIELGEYNGIPYILEKNKESISDSKEGYNALVKILKIIEERIHILLKEDKKDIKEYNTNHKNKWEHLFIIIDESNDILKIKDSKEVMEKILDYGKVVGIHMIIATNGYMKNFYETKFLKHFKYRMSFDLASKEQASYIEIDGADLLKESGNALVKCPNNTIYNVMTPYISNKDIENIVHNVCNN